jgi:two-component system sensor histidine kinase KdpD
MGSDRLPDNLDAQPGPDKPVSQFGTQEEQLRGERLKVFLGYASGVGKSFRMLDEGRRRRARGQDVVIGALQPALPPELERLVQIQEVIPPKKLEGGESMDVEGILRRRPRVCLVDGLAYDNPPGSRNPKRWQDVDELINAGIVVITSLNLQHIAERRAVVEKITGKRVTQTVPERFLYAANEIVIVDVPPELLLERAGQPSTADPAVADTMSRLSALREIALLLTAEVVDKQLEDYLVAHGIERHWGVQERILICLAPGSDAQPLLASGKRNADRFHGELFAVYIRHPSLSEEEETRLKKQLEDARQLNAHVEVLDGDEPVEALMAFAQAHRVTQIFVGRGRIEHWWDRFWGGPIDRLIRAAEGMDVRVFPH